MQHARVAPAMDTAPEREDERYEEQVRTSAHRRDTENEYRSYAESAGTVFQGRVPSPTF